MSENGATPRRPPGEDGGNPYAENIMDFRIRGLDPKPFQRFFEMSEAELARHRARRRRVDSLPGAPCRIALADAPVDSEVLLLNYEHLPVDSPYRASHAIYVSTAREAFDAVNVVPQALRDRLLSVRAFDSRGNMLDADIAEGTVVEPLIDRLLELEGVEYLHAHFARRGCFAARIDRA
jgi:hypothetical protein